MKPFLLLLGGSIGVGKTTMAYRLKHNFPNTCIIENDTIRRELMGFPLNYFMNHNLDHSFSTENNQRVDTEMDERTKTSLQQGMNVIRCHVDVSADDIERYQKTYPEARMISVYLAAPENVIKDRLKKRKNERDTLANLAIEHGHASDADENVLLKFPIKETAPQGWITLDATQTPEALQKIIIDLLSTEQR